MLALLAALTPAGTVLYAGGDVSGVWRRNPDAGWEAVNQGFTASHVYALDVDPTDPRHLLAASRRGLYQTRNGGDLWTQVNSASGFLDYTAVSFSGLSILAGTADGRIFRSTNSGQSFTAATVPNGGVVVTSFGRIGSTHFASTFDGLYDTNGFTLSPTLPRNAGGVWVSTNGGADWGARAGSPALTQAFHLAHAGSNLYAVVPDELSSNAVWRSGDLGLTWQPLSMGLAPNEDYARLLSSGSNLWLTAGKQASGAAAGVWRLTGNTLPWQRVARPAREGDAAPPGGENVERPFNSRLARSDANSVAVNPANTAQVFYCGRTIHRSDDDGVSWVGDAFQRLASGTYRHRGLNESAAWYLRRHPDPLKRNIVLWGDLDWGMMRSSDHGQSWVISGFEVRQPPFASWGTHWSPDIEFDLVRGVAYAARGFPGDTPATNTGLMTRSTDDGQTWAVIGQPTLPSGFIRRIAIDLRSPPAARVLYAVVRWNGVFKTSDGGSTWVKLAGGLPSFPDTNDQDLMDVVVDPLLPDTVYVSLERSGAGGPGSGGIWKSSDAGAQWARIDVSGPASFADLAIKPDNSQVMLASSTRGIYRSTNGGVDWIRVFDRNITIFSRGSPVAFDLRQPTTAYAGATNPSQGQGATVSSLLKSTNAGATWEELNTPLGGGSPRATSIHVEADGEIFVSTYGMGGAIFVPR